jgi:hypothetical protein
MVAGYVWVWVVPGFLGKWGGERERKKHLKSSSSLPLHAQGRRRTVPFKTALFQCSGFFFLRKENVTWKNPKLGYDNGHIPSVKFSRELFLARFVICKSVNVWFFISDRGSDEMGNYR